MRPATHLIRASLSFGLTMALSSVYAEQAQPSASKTPAAEARSVVKASVSAKPDKSEMICTTERVTGSRFARKLCHTREELDAMRRAGTETVIKIQEMPIPVVPEEGRGGG